MYRQFVPELHLGQKVLVHINPTAHPIEALVTGIDRERGIVDVNPIGYKIRWQARPRAISNTSGQFLQFDGKQFFFGRARSLN